MSPPGRRHGDAHGVRRRAPMGSARPDGAFCRQLGDGRGWLHRAEAVASSRYCRAARVRSRQRPLWTRLRRSSTRFAGVLGNPYVSRSSSMGELFFAIANIHASMTSCTQ
ncbi:hypothetical protein VTO73DRAFT_2863 [Trametes versicolor]